MSERLGIQGARKNEGRAFRKAVFYFLLSLIMFCLLFSFAIRHRLEVQQLSMGHLIVEKSITIREVISKLLYKTEALAALVIQNNGIVIRDFDRVAATVVDDPAILNILLAPGGVVSHVYPPAGNDRLIGYNLLGDGPGNREAVFAKKKGELVFGGPFPLMQGGTGLVGRLPVWLGKAGQDRTFWGLVSVTLKYPEALIGAGLESMAREGFLYEIWRTNPDDGTPQVIATNVPKDRRGLPYIEQGINILNANWHFRIMPVRHWYEFPEIWFLLGAGFCISVLIGMIIFNNASLKRMKDDLETMVRTDALTGVLNRTGLFYVLSDLVARNNPFYLHYFDLNLFKQINDTFGHNTGDMVLIEFCRRINNHATSNYFLARISGDEFVLLYIPFPASKEEDPSFWEHIDREFQNPMSSLDGTPIPLTYSKGTALYPEDGTTIDDLIACADQRMYEDKMNKYAKSHKRRASDLTSPR